MATEPLEQAIATTRSVLAKVPKEKLGDATPCTQWKVSDLINHIVGGQYFFAGAARGEAPVAGETDFSATDFLAAYDDGSHQAITAFQADGVLEKTLTLPWGQMPGSAFMGVASVDTFAHGWDLARATGQNADLAPELATALLNGAKVAISPAFRSEDGAVFGLEQQAPAGASPADQLAAFLGRKV